MSSLIYHNFGGISYRIKDHVNLKNAIFQGLSDWYAANVKTLSIQLPTVDTPGFAEAEFEVEYNVYGRDIDKLAVVMYASDSTEANDGKGEWHIVAGDADAQGNLIESRVKYISGNSGERDPNIPPETLNTFLIFREPMEIRLR